MSAIEREQLPTSYLDWLASSDAGKIEYQGTAWKLRKEHELAEELVIDGKAIPFFKALTRVASSLTDTPSIRIEDGGVFAQSRFDDAFAIAEDNFDFLFFEHNGTVWSFWHSELCVSKVAECFSDALTVSPDESEIAAPALQELFGTWRPVSSTTDDMNDVFELWPTYTFKEGDVCEMAYKDGEIEKSSWHCKKNDLDNRQCIEANGTTVFLQFMGPNTLSLTNKCGDLQIQYARQEEDDKSR